MHNKCYTLLPDFILECISLGVKVDYVVSFGNKFKVIPVQDDFLDVLQELRKQSNEYAGITYEKRMDNIKQCMMDRNASQEQFDELKKTEKVYYEMIRHNKNIKKTNIGRSHYE